MRTKAPLQMRHWRRGFSRSLTARRRHHEQGAGHRREHGDHCKQQPVDAYGLSEGRQQAGSEYDEKRNPGARRSIQPSKAFAPYHGEQTAAQAEQRAGHDAQNRNCHRGAPFGNEQKRCAGDGSQRARKRPEDASRPFVPPTRERRCARRRPQNNKIRKEKGVQPRQRQIAPAIHIGYHADNGKPRLGANIPENHQKPALLGSPS